MKAPISAKAKPKYIFTKKDRKNTCLHEAAHAVIYSAVGIRVFDVTIANVNNINNHVKIFEGIGGIVSIDQSSDGARVAELLTTVNSEGKLISLLEPYPDFVKGIGKKHAKQMYKDIESIIIGGLAGFAVESLVLRKWSTSGGCSSDFEKTTVLCDFLPGGSNEFTSLVSRTMDLVQSMYSDILKLAQYLENHGQIDFSDIDLAKQFLPKLK